MNQYEERQLMGENHRPGHSWWKRLWHKLGFNACEGEWFCEMCGRNTYEP